MPRQRAPRPTSFNYLDSEKLGRIPDGHHAQHEFCFYVHDTLLHLLREADASHIRSITLELTPAERDLLEASPDDPIGVLLGTSKRADARRVLLNHVILALCADTLNFVYEALMALSKRKYTVSLTLFRKPFRENLLYLSWLLADEDDFFARFESGPATGMETRAINANQRIEIFRQAIKCLITEEVFNSEHLHWMIFDKSKSAGLAQLFDKAVHLVTSSNSTMRTEELNFNFIFKNPDDDDIFDSLYPNIGYVLMYMFSVIATLFSRVLPIEEAYVSRIVLIMFGAYHDLFSKGHSPVMRTVRRAFRDFMKCPVCKQAFSIRKGQVARFLIAERVVCGTCGSDTDFPILWLLGQAGFSVAKSP